jgi:hypothetical protein
MNDNEINDVRKASEFRSITFSGYQKVKVKKTLIECLSSSKIEPACYWFAELICAGHFVESWELIILFVSKYLHLGNPLLPTYISRRMDNFKDIISNGYIGNELRLRNNQKVRTLFAEIAATLCLSRRRHVFEAVKIKKKDEFNLSHMTSKLKAPNISFIEHIFTEEDPKELFIAANEFAYHLSDESKNCYTACYWLEWMIEFEMICKKNKDVIVSQRREWVPVDEKYKKDPIWLVWDIILRQSEKKNCKITKKVLESLLGMFCLRFTVGVKKRRRFLMYYAIAMLTEIVDKKIPIWSDKKQIKQITSKINIIYKQIKKNEKAPATDYLFAGTEKSNLDKTIERLEKMNQLMGI